MKATNFNAIAFLAALASCSDASDDMAPHREATATPAKTEQADPASQKTADRNPQSANQPSFDEDMAYFFSQGERGPVLSFGVPQTDNVSLSLRCPPGAMGKTILVSFNRPERIVAQRPDTIMLKAGNASQRLEIETRATQLGTTVEVEAAPDNPVMLAYRRGAPLIVSYGDEDIAIPSQAKDSKIEEFFNACLP